MYVKMDFFRAPKLVALGLLICFGIFYICY